MDAPVRVQRLGKHVDVGIAVSAVKFPQDVFVRSVEYLADMLFDDDSLGGVGVLVGSVTRDFRQLFVCVGKCCSHRKGSVLVVTDLALCEVMANGGYVETPVTAMREDGRSVALFRVP